MNGLDGRTLGESGGEGGETYTMYGKKAGERRGISVLFCFVLFPVREQGLGDGAWVGKEAASSKIEGQREGRPRGSGERRGAGLHWCGCRRRVYFLKRKRRKEEESVAAALSRPLACGLKRGREKRKNAEDGVAN